MDEKQWLLWANSDQQPTHSIQYWIVCSMRQYNLCKDQKKNKKIRIVLCIRKIILKLLRTVRPSMYSTSYFWRNKNECIIYKTIIMVFSFAIIFSFIVSGILGRIGVSFNFSVVPSRARHIGDIMYDGWLQKTEITVNNEWFVLQYG